MLKECDFHKYCETCKYHDIPETDDPCNDCLHYTANDDSHKPVRWEDKDG